MKAQENAERAERVAAMEARLDRTAQLSAELSRCLDELGAARDEMSRLFQYYGSSDWFEDRESPLPKDVKAGVLSEDLVYDEFTALRDACYRMLELSTDLLKNVL